MFMFQDLQMPLGYVFLWHEIGNYVNFLYLIQGSKSTIKHALNWPAQSNNGKIYQLFLMSRPP